LLTQEEGDTDELLPDQISIDFLLDKLLDLEENYDEEEEEGDETGELQLQSVTEDSVLV